MFGRSISIFKLFGFDIRIDLSWIIIVVLITWSLATGLFPFYYHNLTQTDFWIMGFCGAIGLFASIVLHEVSHSIVAGKYGLPIKSITLFLFGGVASLSEEPGSAKVEFLMAIAGPVTSIFIGIIFYLARAGALLANLSDQVKGVLGYLAVINLALAAFNLIPAFPLDGGRIFRAALWKWMKNLRKATRAATIIGSVFGITLIILGIVQFIFGYIINGVWWFVIGFFLDNAARTSYKRVLFNEVLAGEKVADIMMRNAISVPPDISVNDLVENYIYKYHHKMFPVVEDGNLVGCVTTEQVRDIPRSEWGARRVEEMTKKYPASNIIDPGLNVIEAWALMNRTGITRLAVVQDGKLAGVITSKDILRVLSLKMELNT